VAELRDPDNDIAGSTVDNNRTHFDVHILPSLGDLPIAQLDGIDAKARLAEWIRQLKQQKGARGRQSRNVGSLSRTIECGILIVQGDLQTSAVDPGFGNQRSDIRDPVVGENQLGELRESSERPDVGDLIQLEPKVMQARETTEWCEVGDLVATQVQGAQTGETPQRTEIGDLVLHQT
jgi:hypothetical protein